MKYVIGVDAGTTGITAVLYDLDLFPHRGAQAEIAQHYPRPAWVEHDPLEIRDTTIRLLRKLTDGDFSQVAALGITNQRETIVAFDAETGRPLAPAIVWQCRRSADICRRLEREGRNELVRRTTGLLLDPYFSASKMLWLLENDRACQEHAARGTLRFATVDAWLVHQLTGGRSHATDPTNASRTMLFDIDEGGWSDPLLDLFGVKRQWLPEVIASSGTFGETDPAVLGGAVPITGVLGDQQAALYGQGCFGPETAKCTFGTGAFVLVNTGRLRPEPGRGLLVTVAADEQGGAAYALEGSVFIAGAAIQWLRDALGIIATATEAEELARSLHDNGGVHLVPAFAGLGAPWWEPEARGLLSGLTRGSGRAHLARAALESIAFQVADLLGVFERDGGVRIGELRADGGACLNDFLMEFQANVAGIPVLRGADLESTARGAAAVAAVGAKLIRSPLEAAAIQAPRVTFPPRMPAAERERLLAGWHQAVERARLGAPGRPGASGAGN